MLAMFCPGGIDCIAEANGVGCHDVVFHDKCDAVSVVLL